MTYRHLNLTRTGYCATVRLLEPASCLSGELASELDDVLCELAASEDIRVVVLVFAGAMEPGLEESEPLAAADAVESVARLPQPVVAAIEGDAIGSALELALACDLRFAVEGARFGLPQVGAGHIPCAGGTQRLPRLVGRGKAMEMVLTGTPIDVEEALRLGLVQRVVPVNELETRTAAMAAEIAEASPLSMRYVKEALYAGMDLTLDQGMRLELDLYLLLFSTSDREEGITAFREKRKPRFKGV